MNSEPPHEAPSSAPAPELIEALLDELAASFELGFPIGDSTLGEMVAGRLRGLRRHRRPAWGSPGDLAEVSSTGSPTLRFSYRPHLFPGMDPLLELAHELQFDLLPTALPEPSPVRVAAVLESYCHLSGDLLGWAPVGEGGLLLWMIDVSGHGVRAGLTSAVIRMMMIGNPGGGEPDGIARELQRSVRACRNPTDRRPLYATGVFVRLDAHGGARWSSAGHPPALLRRRDGRLERLGSKGPPIALLDDADWQTESFELEPGDTLVLYTDGVVDHPDGAGEPFGAERLERLVELPSSSAEAFAQSLYRAVSDHGSIRHLDDDLTFLVARRPSG